VDVKELAVAACLAAMIALPVSALAYLVHAFAIIVTTGNYMPQPEPAIHLAVLAAIQVAATAIIYGKMRRFRGVSAAHADTPQP
jgi:hypothetical protein